MPEVIERSDGVKLVLPPINVSSSWNCTHVVSIDNIPLDMNRAIGYLLADRERIMTQLADAKAKIDELSKE